jgi:hypothetical protein
MPFEPFWLWPEKKELRRSKLGNFLGFWLAESD